MKPDGSLELPSPERIRAALAAYPTRFTPPGTASRAAVLVPLMTVPEPGVLLTRRAAHLRRHAGQVCFPGGRMEAADASPEQAALREANEEIGLEPSQIILLGRLPEQLTGTGFHVVPVVGLLQAEAAVAPAAAEVAAIFTLPLSVLLDPASPAVRTLEVAGVAREVWTWPHPQHDIWGATAAMLRELAAVLAQAALGA